MPPWQESDGENVASYAEKLEEAIAPRARIFALAMSVFNPGYHFSDSALASSDFNLSVIIEDATALVSAFESIVRAAESI